MPDGEPRPRLRRVTRRLLGGRSQSLHYLHLKAVREDSDARTARAVVDLAVRVAELGLASGATAAESAGFALRVIETGGLHAHVDVTFTTVTITQHRSLADDPITAMRIVRSRGSDYGRLAWLSRLVDEHTCGRLDLDEARERFDAGVDQPPTYRRWVVVAAGFAMGAAVAALLGGGGVEILIAGLVTGLVEVFLSRMLGRGLSAFLVTAMAAAIPTLAALGLMLARVVPGPFVSVSPSLIVAAGMVSLLAGLGVVTAARDAIDGYYITAGARSFEVLVLTAAIVLGLWVTLSIGLSLGVPGFLAPSAGQGSAPAVQLVCAGVIAVAFGVSAQLPPRAALACGGLGVLLWTGYLFGFALTQDHASAAGIGAVAVGVIAQLAAKTSGLPVIALTAAGISPLMPGLLLYRGIFIAATHAGDRAQAQAGAELLWVALVTGLALAAGSSIGNLLARPVPAFLPRGRRVG